MGKKMNNAPVYYVVAQVRFNPITTMDQYIPAIQDSLRKSGFPDFQKHFIAVLNLNFGSKPVPDQPVSATNMPQAQHIFLDEEGHSGFVLEQMAMSFQTSHYDTFEPFLRAFMRGLETVHKNAELSFYERVGIRFLDAILPADGEDVSTYLAPNMLGLFGKMENRKFVHAVSETRTQEGRADLTSRAVIYHQDVSGPIAFPADLAGQYVKIMDKFNPVSGTYGVIDTDSSQGGREKFNLKSIEEAFISLHSVLRESFDLMVTPHALNVWK